MFEKQVVIDCRGHLLGRLASTIAKELLNGQKIVAVRCEAINISGSLFRNKLKYHDFLRKRTLTNPTHGPVHFRAPSKILWRTIRGMVPHKLARGRAAMSRLKVFEGVPPQFEKVKRMVIPNAIRVARLRPGRNFCVLGELASQVGWKHADTVRNLEEQRKIRAEAFHQKRKAFLQKKQAAIASSSSQLATVNQTLEKHGY